MEANNKNSKGTRRQDGGGQLGTGGQERHSLWLCRENHVRAKQTFLWCHLSHLSALARRLWTLLSPSFPLFFVSFSLVCLHGVLFLLQLRHLFFFFCLDYPFVSHALSHSSLSYFFVLVFWLFMNHTVLCTTLVPGLARSLSLSFAALSSVFPRKRSRAYVCVFLYACQHSFCFLFLLFRSSCCFSSSCSFSF